MKIKLNKTKHNLNESLLLALGVVALLAAVLIPIYKRLGTLIKTAGNKLDNGVQKTQDAINNLDIPEAEKKSLLEKLNQLSGSLKQKLQNVQNEVSSRAVSIKEKPSIQIAKQISSFNEFIEQVKKQYSEQIQGSKQISNALQKAQKQISECVITIKNLDFIAAVSSKEDPNGLWSAIKTFKDDREFLRTVYKDNEWIEFVNAIVSFIGDEKKDNFKASSGETPQSAVSESIFKYRNGKFLLTEGYGSTLGEEMAETYFAPEGSIANVVVGYSQKNPIALLNIINDWFKKNNIILDNSEIGTIQKTQIEDPTGEPETQNADPHNDEGDKSPSTTDTENPETKTQDNKPFHHPEFMPSGVTRPARSGYSSPKHSAKNSPGPLSDLSPEEFGWLVGSSTTKRKVEDSFFEQKNKKCKKFKIKIK